MDRYRALLEAWRWRTEQAGTFLFGDSPGFRHIEQEWRAAGEWGLLGQLQEACGAADLLLMRTRPDLHLISS